MPLYRPRAIAFLKLPVAGTAATKKSQEGTTDLVDIPVRLRRCMWLRNDANHADEVSCEAEWYDAGFDVRYLSTALVSVHIGESDDRDNFTPDDTNLRFVGIVTRPRRASDTEGRLTIAFDALDLTTLFIRVKPYRTVGIPALSMTLSEAWRLICDNTGFYDHQNSTFVSTVQSLKDRLIFQGGASDVPISQAVPARFKGYGKVQTKAEMDAWAVWQQCIGMCGLISYIDRGDCIVTTALDFYSAENPARFIYGVNVREHEEDRDCDRSAMGIGLTSFDPITATTIEAFYPPLGDTSLGRSKRKRAIPEGGIEASKYQMFPYPSITDPDLLAFAARRVFEEVSRQDLQGAVSTAEMRLPRQDGSMVDVMSLVPGDAISVEFDEELKSAVLAKTSTQERVAYLVGQGYSQATAEVMAANVQDFTDLRPECSVKTVGCEFEVTPEGGRFEVKVQYNARVQLTGDTDSP